MHELKTALHSRTDLILVEAHIAHLNKSIQEVVRRKAMLWGEFKEQELVQGMDDMIVFIDSHRPASARHAIIYWQTLDTVHPGILAFASSLAYRMDGYARQKDWIKAVSSPDYDWYISNGDVRHSCPSCDGRVEGCVTCAVPQEIIIKWTQSLVFRE